ncbi:MAG: CvpA family protein [Burkholderiales bacterium]|nr:CvpA family protein [Burkholderiales bacterium]
MTLVDYSVFAILGLSVLISVWRGAVREVLALGGWVLAFLAAQAYAGPVGTLLPASIESPGLRLLLSFAAVFLLILFLTTLVAVAISRLLHAAGLGSLDRGLGAIFGLARGILVVMILVLLCGLSDLPRTPVWRDAMLRAPLEAAAASVLPFLPYELARHIRFD